MSISHGMSVEDVEALGNALQKKYAEHVRVLINEIEHQVGASNASWVGPDGERFRTWWPEKRARMLAMADDLHGFGQSALNNASEQRAASGGAPNVAASPPPVGDSLAEPSAGGHGGVTPPGRSWQEVRDRYDAWATGRFAQGGVSHYQCTGWANFRWSELGYGGGAIGGNGGAMAANAGPTSHAPSLHAMASYGAGTAASPGHVMIVEEVSPDGSTIRVSEMNVGDQNWDVGTPEEFRDTKMFARGPDGVFRSHRGEPIRFAAFPG